MTVRIYRSTDGSAPTLTGQAGSLTTLLDAVLVNGYGSQTAAGWTISQTTTNKRGYLQNTSGSNNPSGMLLWVDDSAVTTAKEARCTGFETMTGLGTGTGQFPATGQGVATTTPNAAVILRKSTTADATARAWTCVANGQSFYFFAETGDQTSPIAAFPFFFGDFFSYKTSDQYAVGITGRVTENTAAATADLFGSIVGNTTTANLSTTFNGHYVARSWTGLGGSVQVGQMADERKMLVPSGASTYGTSVSSGAQGGVNGTVALGRAFNATFFPYPNGPDGACWVSPVWLNHTNAVRGYYPGLWAPLHDRPLNHNDTYTVSGGNLNGKSMVVQAITIQLQNATDVGQVHIETSNTWA
jgi:hypothetical protein